MMNFKKSFKIFFLITILAVTIALPATASWESGISITANTAKVSEIQQNHETSEGFKSEVLRLINIERVNNGLNALQEMPTLNKLADVRAQESNVLFSHKRPNGTMCSTIFSDYDLSYSTIGENLAYGYSTPSTLVKAWMNSKSHRENILSNHYTYTGIGYYKNQNGTLYCSQLFYTPQSQ